MKRTTIQALGEVVAESFAEYAILYQEHLVCVFNDTELTLWFNNLGFTDQQSLSLVNKLQPIREYVKSIQVPFGFSSGAIGFGLSQAYACKTLVPNFPINSVNLPAKVDLLAQANLTPIRDQGSRGTCVSHAMIKLKEIQLNTSEMQSPAFNYYFAKQLDNNNDEDTRLESALEVLKVYGSCPEKMSPYSNLLVSEELMHFKPNPLALMFAKKNTVDDWFVSSNGDDVITIGKLMLSGAFSTQPRPMVIGTKIFPIQIDNIYSQLTGEWAEPTPFHDNSKFYLHAMLLVGLHDDDNYPGGGFGLLVQSWGNQYAKQGAFGQGIVTVSYQFLKNNCLNYGSVLQKYEKSFFKTQSKSTNTHHKNSEKSTAPQVQTLADKWQFSPYANNHIGIFGGTGSGKTTQACKIITRAMSHSPNINWQYFDPTGEMAKRLAHLNPLVINVENNGLPMPLLNNLRGTAIDIKTNSLINDLQWSSLSMGPLQIEELKMLIEVAIKENITDNLVFKEFLVSNLAPKLKHHINDFLMLLRSNKTVSVHKPGVVIHDLSAFDESPTSRALYIVTSLRHTKNQQFNDNSQPCMKVFEEGPLLLNKHSKANMERFYAESRKLNIGSIFIGQEVPTQTWLTTNLAYSETLKVDDNFKQQNVFANDFLSFETMNSASFTEKNSKKANWLTNIFHKLG
ncbi:MAG: DUF87 domain-containing protein [Colwellia sp.]